MAITKQMSLKAEVPMLFRKPKLNFCKISPIHFASILSKIKIQEAEMSKD